MKNFKTLLLTVLLSTTATFAQIEDKWKISEFEQIVVQDENNKIYTLSQSEITEVITPAILDPEDRYKLNQDIIYLPTQVTKTIRSNYDKDYSFDKKVKFEYLKSDNVDLEFILTRKGIQVNTDDSLIKVDKILDKNSVLFLDIDKIRNEGFFTVILNNGEKINLNVSNYEIIK